MTSKLRLITASLLLALCCQCSSTKPATANAPQQTQPPSSADGSVGIVANNAKPKTTGYVSHRYLKSGCGTAIITNVVDRKGDTLILFPIKGLGCCDTDGMRISFHFDLLAIPNTKGCNQGNPAAVRDVVKVNR